MKKPRLLTIIAVALAAIAANGQKYVGGDISLLTKYEENGATYFDHDGNAINAMLPFLKNEGLNAMRVRLFVDPSQAPSNEQGEGVCQDIDYVSALGKRIKDNGFALMLDFHYSDSWADPAKQYTPKAWEDLTDDELYAKIYEYTKESLQKMIAAGATPDMIQIGNEISYGMLWGKRATGSMKYYAKGGSSTAVNNRFFTLLKKASQACREVCPAAKIVIHTERVGEIDYLTAFYNAMKEQAIDYDIIGLSYYPYYHGFLPQLESALTTVEQNFPDKRIMIVETGYYNNWQPSGVDYDYSATYPITDDGQKAFTEALVKVAASHQAVDGLFWWFLEANEHGLDWNTKRVTDSWYNAGLFDNNTGKAMSALSVLKDFLTLSSIGSVNAAVRPSSEKVYSIGGRIASIDGITDNLATGVYIQSGRKMIVR